MTTQYKMLPSEPTDEMFSIACKTYDEHSVMEYVEPEAMLAALNAHWQHAPEVEQPKRESLTDYEVLLAVGSVKIQPLTDDFILEVARVIEKAHGIGV